MAAALGVPVFCAISPPVRAVSGAGTAVSSFPLGESCTSQSDLLDHCHILGISRKGEGVFPVVLKVHGITLPELIRTDSITISINVTLRGMSRNSLVKAFSLAVKIF